jgi:cysteine sulfinate desulfinase/cysteine desulfurase-like protein
MGSTRFSLGRYNSEDEVDTVVKELERIIPELRRIAGVSA